MRRAVLSLLAAAAVAAVAVGAGGEEKTYRVDAIFDNAASLIPGQDVQIAGAVVGSVDDVALTPDRRARVTMKIRTGFAPFRTDASCSIKPQSLIGEKFVACDPGTPDTAELKGRDGGTPTIPIERNHAPVDIDLVFAALRRPYVERLSIVVNEFGTGMAGRPKELSAAIHRANPALQESQKVLAILNRDRALLGTLIDRTDRVLAEVSHRDRDVTRFISEADKAATEVAKRRDALGRSIDRLPPLLAELEPSARSLASVSRDARPLLRSLREATPALRAVLADLEPVKDEGRPALKALRSTSDEGRKAVKAARPVAKKLRSAARLLPHVADMVDELTESLVETGAPEGLGTFVWLATLTTSRFDRVSHIIPSYQIGGTCNVHAEKPLKGCSAHWPSFADQGSDVPEPQPVTRARKRSKHGSHEGPTGPAAPTPKSQLPTPAIPGLPDLPSLPSLPTTPETPDPEDLLDFLLGT